MLVSCYNVQNQRQYNQDRFTVVNHSTKVSKSSSPSVFCIFDGHGEDGHKISTYLNERIPSLLAQQTYPIEDPIEAKKIFDEIAKDINTDEVLSEAGSTAICMVSYDHKYFIWNTGDCRAVLSRAGRAVQLTKDHKPSRYEERIRIEKLGGKIDISQDDRDARIKGLSVSRAFGDTYAQPFVSHEPDVFQFTINPTDEFVIIGCDGLWDEVRNEIAVDIVRNYLHNTQNDYKGVAQELARQAIQAESRDNITIIVVFFSRYFQKKISGGRIRDRQRMLEMFQRRAKLSR